MGLTIEQLGGWPAVLGRLMAGEVLTADEAGAVLGDVLAGNAAASQVAAFVTALRLRGETVEEMAGLVRAMVELCDKVDIDGEVLDTCGTGGDRSNSINVSTLAGLVVAGAGVAVCKHGGRAASSATGTADVLEALGVSIDLGPVGVARCVAEAGMGFCFAPRFHPAMRFAAPVRRELGVATVFNFLGPLANPARARLQVVGVSDPAMAHKMVGVLAANGTRRAMVVHGHDGLDELTTTTTSTVVELVMGPDSVPEVNEYVIDPRTLGLAPAVLADLRGGDAAINAGIIRRVLAGERGPFRDIVLLNAAAALVVADRAADLSSGLEQAGAAIDQGRAEATLDTLIKVSRRESTP